MMSAQHEDIFYNDLNNGSIRVYIQESGEDRRPAFSECKSLLKPGESDKLIGLREKSDIKLIIRSRLANNLSRFGKRGIKLHLTEKLNPHHIEIKRDGFFKYALELHFESPIPPSKIGFDLDPKVKHPGG